MLSILQIVGPLLLIALTGYLTARGEVLSREHVMGLGRFLVVVALPAVLVLSISSLPVREVLAGPFIALYLAIGATLGTLVWLLGRRVLGASGAEAATMTLGVTIPNNIIIGYPLSLQMFGDDSLPMFVAVILVENVVFLPLALLVFERSVHAGKVTPGAALNIGKRVLGNPITIGVMLGMALSLFAIPLPDVLISTLKLLGGTVSGMALFYVGALLAGSPHGQLTSKVLSSALGRIVGGPLLAALVITLVPVLNDIERACLVLFCAAPCFSILPAIAAGYGEQDLGAGIQVTGTTLAALTLPIVMIFVA